MTQRFVGNIPYTVGEEDIRARFECFGRVSSVRIPTDPTDRPRGFAFVSMPSFDDADEAISRLSGCSWGGRRLTVNAAENRNDSATKAHNPETRAAAIEFFDAIRAD
ncbi:MAG: RNA-binding protein [Planctomycetaceae bacterium]|nr:RNA-binding protein [Planctomycetaceae bacterium]